MKLHKDLIGTSVELTADESRYERRFLFTDVTASNKLRAVTQASGIPKVGDPHPDDPTAKATSVFAQPASSQDGLTWEVLVRYSTQAANADGSETLSLSDPIEVRYEARTITETTIYDRHGDKMTTFYVESLSVGGAANRVSFRSAHRVEIERPGVVINITRTTREAPDILNARYGARVNSGKWGRYDRYQVLCEGFEGQGQRGSNLWRVTGRFYPSPLLDGTWRTQLFSRNSSGVFPIDARLGRGIEQYEPYKLAALRNSGFVP